MQDELKKAEIRVQGKAADQRFFFKKYRILSPNHVPEKKYRDTIFCFVTLIYVTRQCSFGLNNDGTHHDYNKPVDCLRLLSY
jgi:hypothetical protein